jgi:hypothetical protein
MTYFTDLQNRNYEILSIGGHRSLNRHILFT